MEKLVSLCKRRGFIFQSSEIYGGINACWDYGPLGVNLKNNVKRLWWEEMTQRRDDVEGLDAAILMHPTVWKASGHVDSFTDPFVSCRACRRHYRADQVRDFLWESAWFKSLLRKMKGVSDSRQMLFWAQGDGKKLAPNLALVERPEVTLSFIAEKTATLADVGIDLELNFERFVAQIGCQRDGTPRLPCPQCGGELTDPAPANLMLSTFFGPVLETAEKVYLRPETAQGIFVNFENVRTTSRQKVPFGIAQIGKSFRNEISPGNFIFRSREFEQMEMQFFVHPSEADKWFEYWKEKRMTWYLEFGIRKEKLRFRDHASDELAHYARRAVDIEYEFPFGWKELEGIHNRGDYDLSRHKEFSGKDLSYFDDATKERFIPYIIETSGGIDRALLAFLSDAYEEEFKDKKLDRVVMHFHPKLAPIKLAVLPLVNRDGMDTKAQELEHSLRKHFPTFYDDGGTIGRRYRRQDEAGTPFGATVDSQTLQDDTVTLRDRDSMEQIRVPMKDLAEAVEKKMEGWARKSS